MANWDNECFTYDPEKDLTPHRELNTLGYGWLGISDPF